MFQVVKQYLAQILELIKELIHGSTVIKRKSKELEESNSSYTVPNSTLILIAALIAGLLFLIRYLNL